jgi:hypothetical protein
MRSAMTVSAQKGWDLGFGMNFWKCEEELRAGSDFGWNLFG